MNLLESLPTVIGTAAVAPALLILWLVIAADERPGPPLKIWTAFLLGAASISLLGVVRAPFAKLLATPERAWVAEVLRSVFGVALPEEAVKILVIVAVAMFARRRRFADPMDTVVYGAACGVRFSAAAVAGKSGSRSIHPALGWHEQRAGRLQLDWVCRAPGAARRPPSYAAHRARPRTLEPASADVGAAGGRRRRRLR